MSVETFMTGLQRTLSQLNLGINVWEYTLHCFRRGGIQFLDRMGWPIQQIVQWAGWSTQKGCEIDPGVVLRYLINNKEDRFSDLNLTGRGFQTHVDHWPQNFKDELLEYQ
jgi:hypothetical protein